jgi:hypothetical protein
MVKLREWWFVFGAVMFIAGIAGTAFYRYTGYYISEQTATVTQQTLSATSLLLATHLQAIEDRLTSIDKTTAAQQYSDQTAATALSILAAHVHALDERADKDRDTFASVNTELATLNQRVQFLLDPKGSKR